MFKLSQQVFIILLSFTKYLANNEASITRSFVNDLSPAELKHYPFMINLHKYNESFNAVDDLSTKICIQIKQKMSMNE